MYVISSKLNQKICNFGMIVNFAGQLLKSYIRKNINAMPFK